MKTVNIKMQQHENTINVPAFLSKLWRMVNDPATDHLISWSSGGKSFVIQNRAQFWYELLPLYYKHNNMSSFVRQLNMYGFHKLSPVDNGSMELEKDEIQFFHPNFQRNQPELLTNIKRKVTSAKITSSSPMVNVKQDELSKVLQDVKNLRGRQANVDSQLEAMKQENAVLWRELAKLRQKHLKQQQIVNKLIQFLVTIYHPSGSTRMGGLGVKRRYPLMLNEGPEKKSKSVDGPTIHEIDQTEQLSEALVEELEDRAVADSEADVEGLLSDTEINSEAFDQITAPTDIESVATQTDELNDYTDNDTIFLNPTVQDALLTNLIGRSCNSEDKNVKAERADSPDLRVAKVDYQRLNSAEDFHNQLEDTQSELDQFKEILNGYNSLDANALLGLFSYDAPDYVNILSNYEKEQERTGNSDPLVSGSELAPYEAGSLDFSQLFDVASEQQETQPLTEDASTAPDSTINTPQITSNDVPVFPSLSNGTKEMK